MRRNSCLWSQKFLKRLPQPEATSQIVASTFNLSLHPPYLRFTPEATCSKPPSPWSAFHHLEATSSKCRFTLPKCRFTLLNTFPTPLHLEATFSHLKRLFTLSLHPAQVASPSLLVASPSKSTISPSILSLNPFLDPTQNFLTLGGLTPLAIRLQNCRIACLLFQVHCFQFTVLVCCFLDQFAVCVFSI